MSAGEASRVRAEHRLRKSAKRLQDSQVLIDRTRAKLGARKRHSGN